MGNHLMKSRNNLIILTVLSIVCIALIAVTTIKDEWLTSFRTAVGYVLMPVQSGVNRVGKAVYNNITDRERLRSALKDNDSLQQQVDELTAENTRLREDQLELTRLRKLYDLSENYGQYHMTGARIIAKDSSGWFSVFRIDKGSADGIRADMNVMADGGLIGIVTDVGANYATVRSIIDDVSRVSGMEMQSGDTCIVSGDLMLYEQGKLKLSEIASGSAMKDGDRIVTSTVSSKFLPGLLIGYAKDLQDDPSRLTRSGYLIPVADFGTLQEVLVITDLKSEMKETDQGAAAQGSAAAASQESGTAATTAAVPAGTTTAAGETKKP